MPHERRTARAQVSVANGAFTSQEFSLPFITGQLILPQSMHVFIDVSDAGSRNFIGLSHNVGRPALTAHPQFATEPDIWWSHNFSGAPAGVDIDLRALNIELAGPQQLLAFQDSGGTREYGVRMIYFTKMVDTIRWAQIAKATSFED